MSTTTGQGVPAETQSPVVTGPGAAVAGTESGSNTTEKPGFVQQVKGFAKEFAGKTFGKEHEVAQGQAVKEGVHPKTAVAEITPETVKESKAT